MGLGSVVHVMYRNQKVSGTIIGWKEVRGEVKWVVEIEKGRKIYTFDVEEVVI